VRRPIAETGELMANLRAKDPSITQAELARQLGISATRLRQIDRQQTSTKQVSAPGEGAQTPDERDVVSATPASDQVDQLSGWGRHRATSSVNH
jgi:hypothetical protein